MAISLAGNDLYLDANNDLDIQDNDLRIIKDNYNIIQTAICNMSTKYNELDIDPTRGNMAYYNRLKFNSSGMRDVEFQCKNSILQDPRVVDVIDIIATYLGEFECSINFKIKDTNGRIIDGSTAIVLDGG